jgi:AI-2 transport protein TqsA
MTADGTPSISTGITAAVLVLVTVYYGSSVLAPLALALFVIAIVWPLQQWIQSRLPALVALAITIAVTTVMCLGFASLAALAFGRVGRSLVADAARYQTLYAAMVAWLEDRCGATIKMGIRPDIDAAPPTRSTFGSRGGRISRAPWRYLRLSHRSAY